MQIRRAKMRDAVMSSADVTAIRLRNSGDFQRFAPSVMTWIVASAQPFADWLHGSPESASAAVAESLHRTSSVHWLGRISIALFKGESVGGFLAMPGASVAACFVADGLWMLKRVAPSERGILASRLRRAFDPFPPVARDAYFLANLGVDPLFKGRGFGKHVLNQFVAQGRSEGFTEFQLHVFSENSAACNLYTGAGFRTCAEFMVGDGQFRYLSMRMTCS